MAESSNYLKVRDGKYSEEFFFSLRTFGVAHRRAMQRLFDMRRQGGVPQLSVFEHPTIKGKPLLPVEVPCIGGCERCAPKLPGIDPDASDD